MNANVKDIINNVYEGALAASVLVAVKMVTKAMGFKDRPLELKPQSLGMLALETASATYAVKKLHEMGVPENIVN